MEKAVKKVRISDYCPSCGSQHSIELYDVYGNRLELSRMLDMGTLDSNFNYKRFLFLRCMKCGKDYRINYVGDTLVPLDTSIDIDYSIFNKYIEDRQGSLYGKVE